MKSKGHAPEHAITFDERSDVHEHTQRHAQPSHMMCDGAEEQSTELFRGESRAAWPQRGPERLVQDLDMRELPPRLMPRTAARRSVPPPPPPPRAAAPRDGRPLWFVPSLIAAVGLCVAGVLLLLRSSASSTHAVVARSLGHAVAPAAAPVAADTTPPLAAAPEASVVAAVAAPPSAAEPEEDAAGEPPPPAPEPLAALGRCAATPPELIEPSAEPEDPGMRVAPRRKPRSQGMLRLRSSVPSAVYVDGRFVGNTPLRAFSVAPGKHDVALENAVTDQRARFTIVASAGSTIKRHVRLTRAQLKVLARAD